MDTVTAFTQLRTDTTLDLSREAEKVRVYTSAHSFIILTILDIKGSSISYKIDIAL